MSNPTFTAAIKVWWMLEVSEMLLQWKQWKVSNVIHMYNIQALYNINRKTFHIKRLAIYVTSIAVIDSVINGESTWIYNTLTMTLQYALIKWCYTLKRLWSLIWLLMEWWKYIVYVTIDFLRVWFRELVLHRLSTCNRCDRNGMRDGKTIAKELWSILEQFMGIAAQFFTAQIYPQVNCKIFRKSAGLHGFWMFSVMLFEATLPIMLQLWFSVWARKIGQHFHMYCSKIGHSYEAFTLPTCSCSLNKQKVFHTPF